MRGSAAPSLSLRLASCGDGTCYRYRDFLKVGCGKERADWLEWILAPDGQV